MQAKQRQQRSRRSHSTLSRNVRILLSSLVIPLIFGVITILVTLRQHQQADRHFDVHMNFSREQRLDDDIRSQIQREQQWKIAIMNQEARSKIAIDQYRNKLFLDYMKEISVLLKESNSSLTSNSLTHTIARFKTLTVLQHLDGLRRRHVIRFLYEARQLTNTNESNALDISTADLIDIHFDTSSWFLHRGKISLAGVYLQNSTFDEIMLHNVDFSNATLHNVNFLTFGLSNVSFSTANLDNVIFSPARLSNVNFLNARLEDVSFLNATLLCANFANARLYNVNFANPTLLYANFANPTLFYANFANARLYNVTFSSTGLYTIDFSSAFLRYVTFSSAQFLSNDQILFS
jgi:uncharacterized protein YjbI with pentapeptide repeats